MRSMTLAALALSALVGFSTIASAQDGDEQPYRIVTSVVIVPDHETTNANFYLATIDPVDGNNELWDIATYDDSVSGTVGTSLHVDGSLNFSIDFVQVPDSITLTTFDGDTVTVTAATYQTDPVYLALAASVANERGFVQEVMQELAAFGTVQGVVPYIITPDIGELPIEEPVEAAGPACRAACLAASPPKPGDCEGAWDEYLCCVWELLIDSCERKCECGRLPWYTGIPCMSGAIVLNGIDAAACIAGLPIPGG